MIDYDPGMHITIEFDPVEQTSYEVELDKTVNQISFGVLDPLEKNFICGKGIISNS